LLISLAIVWLARRESRLLVRPSAESTRP
jgi:hypothetical protein